MRNDEGLNVTMTVKKKKEINSGDIKKVGQAEGDSFQWDVETDEEGVS